MKSPLRLLVLQLFVPVAILLASVSGCQQNDMDRLARAVSRGDAALQAGAWDLAASEYSDAIRVDPRNFQHYVGRGRAYLGRGHWLDAVRDFTTAESLAPDDADLLYRRALAYEKLGMAEQSSADRARARSLDPLVEAAYRHMPWDYYDSATGLPKRDAKAQGTVAVESDPTNPKSVSSAGETSLTSEFTAPPLTRESVMGEVDKLNSPGDTVREGGDSERRGGETTSLTITEQLLGDLAISTGGANSPSLESNSRAVSRGPQGHDAMDVAPPRMERRVNARIPNLFSGNTRLPRAALTGPRSAGGSQTNAPRSPGAMQSAASGVSTAYNPTNVGDYANFSALEHRRATTVRFTPGATGFADSLVSAAALQATLIREQNTVRIAPQSYTGPIRAFNGAGAPAAAAPLIFDASPLNAPPTIAPPEISSPLDIDRFSR